MSTDEADLVPEAFQSAPWLVCLDVSRWHWLTSCATVWLLNCGLQVDQRHPSLRAAWPESRAPNGLYRSRDVKPYRQGNLRAQILSLDSAWASVSCDGQKQASSGICWLGWQPRGHRVVVLAVLIPRHSVLTLLAPDMIEMQSMHGAFTSSPGSVAEPSGAR